MLKSLMDEKKRCPAAEVRDYCKLLYQSEFGAGHMAADAQTVLARLRDEKIIIPHRKWIELSDLNRLASYCSRETLKP